jgi:hypothetical protein
MFGLLFTRKKAIDVAVISRKSAPIANKLALQKELAGDASIDDANGRPKRKAIGYVYGYVEAALRSIGEDISDASIGVPVLAQVIQSMWPGRATEIIDLITKNIDTDELMAIGAKHGRQQYIDYSKPDAPGDPVGLSRFMIAGDHRDLSQATK